MREPADMSLPAPVAPGEQDVFHTVGEIHTSQSARQIQN